MHFRAVLPAFWAVALAIPVDELSALLAPLPEGSGHIFKRDATITARDMELAELHNVDLEQMYKHSIVKRDNGEHFTIWVDKSYYDDSGDAVDPTGQAVELGPNTSPLSSRQNVNTKWSEAWKGSPCDERHGPTCCASGRNVGDTGPNAPYTGGANAIIDWGTRLCGNGRWQVHGPVSGTSRNLVVAGSNSGFNMRFIVGYPDIPNGRFSNIGCGAVGRVTLEARNAHQQNINGGWRVRASGDFRCEHWFYLDNGVPWPTQSLTVNWWINNSGERVTK